MKKPKILDDLERITQLIPAPIYWEDVNSVVLGGNKALLGGIGALISEALVGKTLYELYPKEMAAHIKEHNEEVMSTGKTLSQEECIQDITTGELKYFTAIKSPLYDDNGEIIGIIGTSIDITERKNMEADLIAAKEKSESALKAKSDFFAVVSHELRTPLTGILGIVELLLTESSTPPEKQRAYLIHVNNASKHLLALINNILDFSKLNEDKFFLRHIPFDFRDVVNQVFNILQVKAIEKNLFLTLDYPTDYPHYFLGDSRALMQVLINLVGNAIKFTKSGGVTLKVIKEHRTTTHVLFNIFVIDSGTGIPQEHLVNIFNRFEQLGAAQPNDEFGTGLGLLVSQKIAHLMGSEILVESIPGEGSVFSMRINFELGSEMISSDFEYLDEKIKPLKKIGLKLLLVEDDFLIQTIHKLKFLSYGFETVVAEDAEQALNLCASRHFDLIFVDIGLPKISGNELIQQIRNNNTLNANTLIIGLTAYADEAHHEQCLQAGANGTLCKPTTNKMFSDLFAQYFDIAE